MKIINKPRCTGKTTELIKIASEENSYIVCRHEHEARRIAEQAESMGLNINFPITFNDFIQHRFFEGGINSFLIDCADGLLQGLAGNVPIKAITTTEEMKK